VAPGATAIDDGRGTEDCNGHGTHVAGTAGGTTYGVAKQTTLVPVRVLGCDGSGSNSGVIAGMDWVADNASGPSVANMSLGGGVSTATDAAVDRMVASGVTVVVAAGNENQNACNVSPAPGGQRPDRGLHDQHRRQVELLELRELCGHLRSGKQHHLGLVHVHHRDEHHLRDIDGLPTRRRGGRALPAGEAAGQPVAGG
jgi:hypothetical protein